MPDQTNERECESCVEEILLMRGGWKTGSKAPVDRWQEYRAALIAAAATGRNQV